MATLIEIEASVNAPVSKTWTTFTDPAHITKWNFADPSWHCPWAKNDLKVGGKYVARMEAKDGSFGFELEAIYDEVVPQKKMTYTMTDGRKVTTTFEPKGNGTKVTTVFEAETQNSVELQKSGWQSILNNFKKYTEEN